MTEEQTKALVDRFLAWPLPASVRSDACVTQDYPHARSGTNLLTSDEARQMIEHLLGQQPVAECTCGAPPEGDGKWGGVHSRNCPAIAAGK